MSVQSQFKQKERTLRENLVILFLIAILLSILLSHFFEQEKNLSTVGFNAVAQKFSSNVISIRAQWFMDGQPASLTLKEKGQKNVHINMTNQGWVKITEASQKCETLWQAIMANELTFMNQKIIVLDITDNSVGSLQGTQLICRFSLANGESFDYFASTGKVSDVRVK